MKNKLLIQTKHLSLHPLSDEELTQLIADTADEGLQQSYREMQNAAHERRKTRLG